MHHHHGDPADAAQEPNLTCQRDLFSLPDEAHYLNCAYMAPLARCVEQAGQQGLQRRRLPAVIQPEDFFEPSQRVRQRFAQLIDRSASEVAILPSVSYGMAIVARNLKLESGSEVLVCGDQFPSNVYPWLRLAERDGATLRTITAPPPGAGRAAEWNRQLIEAIGPLTGLVALPHVHWSDGTLLDLTSIGERSRQYGAALVLDTTQSVGALDLDLDVVRPDALIAAGYKTLFGPYGSAFGWFGERFLDGEPLEETWIARAGSDDFARLVDYEHAYRPGAERFDVGQRSQPILMPMLDAALEMVASWGAPRIQAYAAELWAGVLPELDRLGCWVDESAGRCQHLVGLFPPDGTDLEQLRAELARRQVYVSIRGSAVRVSVQAFNRPSDLEALIDSLRGVL